MHVDPDNLKGKQTREVLSSAMTDLTDSIETVEEALTAAGNEKDAEERAEAREEASGALEELFEKFEALHRICKERLG